MIIRIFLATVMLILGACVSPGAAYDPYVAATTNQLETRSYQTRDFSDVEYRLLMQAMVGTLQDYHFRIREVDSDLGTITAFQNTFRVGTTELTIFIKSSEDKQHTVRINMLTGLKVENEPDLYQKFFTAVRKQIHYQKNV